MLAKFIVLISMCNNLNYFISIFIHYKEVREKTIMLRVN